MCAHVARPKPKNILTKNVHIVDYSILLSKFGQYRSEGALYVSDAVHAVWVLVGAKAFGRKDLCLHCHSIWPVCTLNTNKHWLCRVVGLWRSYIWLPVVVSAPAAKVGLGKGWRHIC